MSTKINLRIKHKKKVNLVQLGRTLTSGSTIFVVLLILLAGAEYVYWKKLTNKSNALAEEITTYQDKIRSYKAIEEQKSLVTVKTSKLQELYEKRFNYNAAIDDINNLFLKTIEVTSMTITENGELTVKAKKSQELKVDPLYTLTSGMSQLSLSLTLNSSEELGQIIQNITSYEAKGLTSASLGKTTRLKDGGYEVELSLTFAKPVTTK